MRLFLDKISVSFGDKQVLQDVSFEANTNDKIAIVGRNGSGKTTLLNVIIGTQEIDKIDGGNAAQKIQKTGKFRIGHLKQIAFDDDKETFEKEILKVYKDITDIKKQIDLLEEKMQKECSSEDALRYEELLSAYEMMGGYTYQKEYNTAIKKFGFSESDKQKTIAEFSGGQRTKIALIKLLLGKPDLLILDEPTNHLDITSTMWLEEYLANYPKAIIVVSHDRAFLDKFVGVVYEIEKGNATRYIGNYSKFIKTKYENREKELKDYLEKKQERDRLQALADRFRYKATKAKMAQSKLKEIERMGDINKPESFDTKVFGFKTKPRIESGNEVMYATDIEIGYDRVLSKLSFRIMKGDKIGVIGGNGLGKSTLLKTIVQKVPLLKGKFGFGTNVEIGYFDQQVASNNISDETVLESYQKDFPEEDTERARTTLGAFCFSGDDVFKNLRDLSGGERVRLELCKIFNRKPNFLILDEPTNHMDILAREALEHMLEDYEGTLLFVSHDRYFVNKIAKHLIVFDAGNARVLKNTTYNEYERSIKNNEADEEPVAVQTKKVQVDEHPQKQNTYLLNKEKARNDAKRKRVEKQIELLESEIKDIEKQLLLPGVYSDYKKVMEQQEKLESKNKELEKLMQEWERLSI